MVQIWPGQTVTCLHTNNPGHIWTTLYNLALQALNHIDSLKFLYPSLIVTGHSVIKPGKTSF